MLTLSSLASGATARLHFLSITKTGGIGTVNIYGEVEVELMADLEVRMEPDIAVEIDSEDIIVEVESDIEVEVCQ